MNARANDVDFANDAQRGQSLAAAHCSPVGEKPRFPNAVGMKVAAELCAALKPVCERLIVAGSLRRRKQTVGDVEILYIGKTEVRQDPADMFASITVNLADEAIAALEKSGALERRKNVNGSEMYGPKNKLMRHRASGLPVDLFSVLQERCPCGIVPHESNDKTTKPDSVQAEMRCVPDVLRRPQSASVLQKMQQQTPMDRVQSQEARQQLPGSEMQDLQKEVSVKVLLEGEADLLPAMHKDSAGAGNARPKSLDETDGVSSTGRLCDDLRPGATSGKSEARRGSDAASFRDGATLGAAAEPMGTCSPQERSEERQPIGESGNRDARETQRASDVPTLPETVSSKVVCPKCNGTGMYAPSWHNYLVCRTGPADSNTRICMAAQERGWKWNPYGAGFSRDGEIRAMESEAEVFAFVGLPYAQPEERR